MKAGKLFRILCVLAAGLLCVRSADAHRLDEYLQATRVAVDPGRVTIEIDLTPGAAITPFVVALIDTNRDGQISTEEGVAYGRIVLSNIVLEVDGQAKRVDFVSSNLPSIQEMNEGVGVIRLLGAAKTLPDAAGRHHLYYRNSHQTEMSVYLANALVPARDRIKIGEQERDTKQHELRFDYAVAPATRTISWLVPLLVLIAMTVGAYRITTGNFGLGRTR